MTKSGNRCSENGKIDQNRESVPLSPFSQLENLLSYVPDKLGLASAQRLLHTRDLALLQSGPSQLSSFPTQPTDFSMVSAHWVRLNFGGCLE